MITVQQSRDKDGMHFEQGTLTFADPLDAVSHLARAELSWGGQIVAVDESRITVQTEVLSCLDTSIFEGTAEEMRPLFELAYFYMRARQEHGDLIVDEAVESLPDRIGGVPLFLSMMAPLLMGRNRLKVAVMLACGVQDVDDIRAGLGAEIENLIAAVQLAQDESCSFREALAL